MDKPPKQTPAHLADLRAEYKIIHRQFLVTFGIALGLLLLGAMVYKHLLRLSWLEAFYFSTTTLATVGYGDISPTTDAAKLFTIFYILIGIGVFASFANLLVKHAALRREIRRTERSAD